MSATPNSTPPTDETGLEPSPGRSGRWKVLVLAGAVLVVAVFTWQLLAKATEPGPGPVIAQVPTATATSGPIERVVRLGGVTSSINFVNVRAPRTRGGERRALVLLDLMESGERVKKGDVAALIDGQGLKDHIDDVQSTVDSSLSDIKKRRAEQTIDLDNLRQEIDVAKSELDAWKLEAGASEIRTPIDQEIINLAVEEAEAAYKQKLADMAVQKAAHEAELRILDITSKRHQRHRDRHLFDLQRYTVNAPLDGMVVRQRIFRSGEMAMVRNGDQVWPGRLFAKVMDTSRMQVEAKINQAESNQFRVGQQVRVGLDAFPDAKFEGRIYSIGALAKGGAGQNSYVREIPIHIHIEGNDPRLIPDLSAYADVIVERADDTVRIPRAALFEEDGQAYVYVSDGGDYRRQLVEVGFRTFTEAGVVRGLEAGDEVALKEPVAEPQPI